MTAPAHIPPVSDPLPREPWSDLGVANRLVAAFGDRLRFVPVWGKWLVWDGCRWEYDRTGQAHRWCKAIARCLTAAALAIPDKAERKAALNLARRAESSHGVRGALTLAGTHHAVAITPNDLDADPFLLNTPAGVLDLRTGKMSPPDPALLLAKITRGVPSEEASSPVFDGFLARVQPEPAMRAYLARLLGCALEGRVTEHLLPVFSGSGANGKSTLASAITYAMGDYAGPADPDLLTARTYDAHPTGVADLFGLRLAILHETDQGRRLAEGTVKRLTGGDRIKARRMREDFWSFAPSHTFVMMTNHPPLVGGTDAGIWRRLRLVPWEVTIPAGEQDGDLADKLALEADGILSWLVGGYAAWRDDGLADPPQVLAATAGYRDQSDALGQFIGQQCLTGPHFTVQSSVLFGAWCEWCRREGHEAGTQTAFSLAMVSRGFDKSLSGGRYVFRRIGLQQQSGGDHGEG